jgi:hypothetical protein
VIFRHHRALQIERLSDNAVQAPIDENACDRELGREFGDFESDGLQLPERSAECLARLHILDRPV